MKSKANIMTSPKFFLIACAIVSCFSLVLATQAAAEPKQGLTAAAASQPQQKQFDTPKQAADALIQVATNFDVAAMKEILGPDSDDIISSEDPVEDKNRATEFANRAKEKTSVEIHKQDPNRAILVVEKDDDSKVNQYAQHILSTPGKHDGLAWQNPDGTWGGPVGEGVAKALEEGYSAQRGQAYHGYYFKVLKGQGPAAPLGQMDFIVKDAMIGGFALAAAPAQYRVTGVQTFIVSHDGVVYEKDLGADTLKAFQSMDEYNPDKTWKVTEEDVEDDSQE